MPLDEVRDKVVDAMVELDQHCIHYKVKLRPDAAHEFFIRADKARVRQTAGIASLIGVINRAIPKSEQGYARHFYHVGREYSRVLYLCILRDDLPGDFNCAGLTAKLKLWASVHNADEAWEVNYPDDQDPQAWYCFRFWWD